MQLLWRTDVPWNPHLLRDTARRYAVVARHHDDADPGLTDGAYHGFRVLAHGVFKPQQTQEAQLVIGAFRHARASALVRPR